LKTILKLKQCSLCYWKGIEVNFIDENKCFSVLIESLSSFGLKLEQEGKILPKANPQNIQLEYGEQQAD